MWQKLVVILVAFVVLLSPCRVVSAAVVEVVAVPYIGGGIINFTATIISDTQVDLTWEKGAGIVNAMVRAKYSEMPMSRTDGYLVYEGSEESVSDTSMNFDETPAMLYYRIWAQNEEGVWNDSDVTSKSLEGVAMLLGAIILLCLGLTIAGYAMHRGSLAFAGSTAWLILGVIAYAQSDGVWNIYMGLFWLSIGMLITCLVEGVMLSRGAEQAEDELEYGERMDAAYKDMDERIATIRARRGR